ncbi:MAG TPA: hypothetical protein VFU81_09360 [Thermomicrobiales bacterium]|nr:hypothetical protein [Thermomicrobiales bacterium]
MDDRRFDALAKSLGVNTPRRVLLKGVGAAMIGAGLSLRGGTRTAARSFPPFTCAGGTHPCTNGRQTNCCYPGEYCCNRKTDNPICTPSKKDCPA